MENEKKKDIINNPKIIKFIIGLLVLGIITIFSITIAYAIDNHLILTGRLAFDKINAYGTFIGGTAGTLITLAATILIYMTYKSQKDELKKTIEIANKQAQTLEKQQFENTFFNMIQILNQITNDIRDRFPGGEKGRDYINSFVEHINKRLAKEIDIEKLRSAGTLNESKEDIKKKYRRNFKQLYDYNSNNLSNYFLHIFSILFYVDESFDDEKFKLYYSRIF